MSTVRTNQDSQESRQRQWMALLCAALALLAVLAPWMARTAPVERVGVLLAIAAVVEIAHGFRRSGAAAQRAAWVNGLVTLAMGILLINAPWVAGTALVLLLAGWFLLDGLRHLAGAVRAAQARRPGPGLRAPGPRKPRRGDRPARPAGARRRLGHRHRRGAAHPRHRVEHHERAGVHGGRFGPHRARRSRAARIGRSSSNWPTGSRPRSPGARRSTASGWSRSSPCCSPSTSGAPGSTGRSSAS